MASESGFSNQKKLGTAQFKTIHNVGGDKFGQSVASKALYEKTAPDYISISDVIGNSGQIEFLNIYYPGHSASINDVLRLNGGLYPNFEFDIISIVDADNFLVLPLLPAIDISGELALIMAWVTNKANADGSQIVTLAPVPLQFVKDSSVVNVNEDTVTPANNSVLPSGLFIYKNGVQIPITKDTGTPANTVGIPVEIVAASGTPINITAGDINVQLTDLGANFDSVRLGDGSGNYVGVNASAEAKVHDADALTKLTSIDSKLTSPLTTKIGNGSITADIKTLGTQVVSTDNGLIVNAVMHGITTGGGGGYVDVKVNPSGALTTESTIVGTVPVSGTFWQATQPVSGPLTDAQLRASVVPVSVSNFPATQTVSGSVSVSNFPATQPVSAVSLPLPAGASTSALQTTGNSSLSSIDGKLPTTIGAKASAASLAVVIASDQVAVSVTPSTVLGSVTSTQKSVGTSAVRATVSGSSPSSVRKRLLIKPSKNNTGAVYLGSSSVTTSNGLEIIGPDRLEFLLDAADYFLISDTVGQVVEILEVA